MEVIAVGNDRFRIGAWRGDSKVGYIMPLTRSGAAGIDSALRGLARSGYRRVVTGALGHDEQGPFLRQGFCVHERLHLLEHNLRRVPSRDRGLPIRRGRRREQTAAIAIDQMAFDQFWRFDQASFDEAVEATPVSRFRVALNRERSRLVGYAIAGRAGRTGYLQRLAVDPAVQGRGIGTALVVDTLTSLDRRGVVNVLVNTQEANRSAFELYVKLGFAPVVPGLAVLEIEL